jgi:NAD kinase
LLTEWAGTEYHFLNELAVHRGNNLRITHVDMLLDDLLVTRVQGDGSAAPDSPASPPPC